MEPPSLPTEVILSHPQRSLGKLQLDWAPQPGAYVDVAGQTYAVLERRHRYALKCGRYHLANIALYVQTAQRPEERSLIGDCWVVGDASCRLNARSALLRCAVNPDGPCAGCRFYEAAGG
jgi:Family of unknown function (DUF6464)